MPLRRSERGRVDLDAEPPPGRPGRAGQQVAQGLVRVGAAGGTDRRRAAPPTRAAPPAAAGRRRPDLAAQRLGIGGGERARHHGQRGEGWQARARGGSRFLRQHRRRARPARPPAARGDPAPASGPACGPRAPPSRARRPAGRRGRTAPACPRSPRAAGPAGADRCRGTPRRRRGERGAAPPRCRSGRGSPGTGDSAPAARGPATSPTSAPRRAASSSRRRLTPARNVFMRSRPQRRAYDRAGLVAARAPQHLLSRGLGRAPRRSGRTGPARRSAGRPAGGRPPVRL